MGTLQPVHTVSTPCLPAPIQTQLAVCDPLFGHTRFSHVYFYDALLTLPPLTMQQLVVSPKKPSLGLMSYGAHLTRHSILSPRLTQSPYPDLKTNYGS